MIITTSLKKTMQYLTSVFKTYAAFAIRKPYKKENL